ncbi:MAG: hypothetical protein AAFM92_03135 [Pseudomonadota bacterium]
MDQIHSVQAAKLEAARLRSEDASRSEAVIRALLIGSGFSEQAAYAAVGPIQDSGT